MYSACVAHISSTCSAGMNMGALFWQLVCSLCGWYLMQDQVGVMVH